MVGTRARRRMEVRGRFWVECALSVIGALLAGVTVVWHDWIEIVLGVDADRGNGSLEWLIVALAMLLAVAVGGVALGEWRLRASV